MKDLEKYIDDRKQDLYSFNYMLKKAQEKGKFMEVERCNEACMKMKSYINGLEKALEIIKSDKK